ncbi:MAG TPA: hypothetical protein VK530_11600 [Candidatus Acidoferrum sp.]|nr:hypothetical protein [Candidatus Acidoferrum sp.]
MKPIHIIGGGLAGLTLGIALRQRDVPVTVSEAGEYPRHRVCGEFISGDGLHVLRRLEIDKIIFDAGARAASTAAFAATKRLIAPKSLPANALCISRFILDGSLANHFVKLGGTLHTRTRVSEPLTSEGVVFATGRRPQAVDGEGLRWFGLKAHARRVQLDADLEMHIGTGSYVGLCRLSDDVVNVCGLYRRRPGEGSADLSTLRGDNSSLLFDRLRDARFDESSFCAVAGLCLSPQPIESAVCRVGDALTMIPPITGNGMSMAFESAELAAGPLTRFAIKESSWHETVATISSLLELAFASRLRWAQRFHRIVFEERGREGLLPLLFGCDWAWRKTFELTRHQ